MRRSRHSIPWVLAVLVGLLPACREGESQERLADAASRGPQVPEPPFRFATKVNPTDPQPAPKLVVLVVVDTLRADHVGCMGSEYRLTPRLDALAERSLVFTRAIATSSWTKSSVASLFTSRYPTALGCLDRDDMLGEDNLTLAEALAVFGGYDGLGVYSNGNVGTEFGFAQGFRRYLMPPQELTTGYPDDFAIHTGQVMTEFTLGEVAEFRRAQRPNAPTFLYVHYIDPHDPYLPHPEMQDEPEPPGRFDGSRRDLTELEASLATATPEDLERVRHLYRGAVAYCDLWIGRLFDGLEQAFGSLDEALIVVTADHGEGLWDHGIRVHGTDLFDEQVRVPLIVHLPGMKEGHGQVIDAPVSLVDVMPTILAQCRIPKPPDAQGFDLMRRVRGEVHEPEFDYVYTELELDGRNGEAIRTPTQKFLRNRLLPVGHDAAYYRFDLAADPRERSNLYRHGNDAATDLFLRDALHAWSAAILAARVTAQSIDYADLDPETLENLRALGYIGSAELESIERRRAEREPARR